MMKKIFSKKNFFILIFLTLLIFTSACKGKKDVKKSIEEIRTGTQGIVINFLPNNPPERIYVEQNKENTFNVILELRNLGAYPQPEEKSGGPEGKVFLSGYDPNIVKIVASDNSNDLSRRALEGKSIINLQGGSDIVTFTGTVDYNKLSVEKYDLTLLATACYAYETVAAPSVCIDPDPYSTIKEKKVCEVKDITLSGQGAPVAVTRIDEEAFAQKTQFKIAIRNVGGGDVSRGDITDSFNRCDPFGTEKLGRDYIDRVFVDEVGIANYLLRCRPFAEDLIVATAGNVRLINGEGSIICELSKEDYPNYKESKTAFTTPLKIRLRYYYRTTAQRNLQIKKEAYDIGSTPASPITSN